MSSYDRRGHRGVPCARRHRHRAARRPVPPAAAPRRREIRRGARNTTRVLAHRERRRRRARVELRSSETPRLVPQPRGASHDYRRDRRRHLDRACPGRAAGRAPATHRRDRGEDTVSRGDGQNHAASNPGGDPRSARAGIGGFTISAGHVSCGGWRRSQLAYGGYSRWSGWGGRGRRRWG